MFDVNFFKGKRVFVTGHTGFKGSWLCKLLVQCGAEVYGYSLNPPTNPSMYSLLNIDRIVHSTVGDIRDLKALQNAFNKAQPHIVMHLSAQPIVRESFKDPVYTYSTNVMGTVNILECVRNCKTVGSVLNVTTDKVYKNNEWCWGYRENEPLDGFDPYSNSKSCSELVTHSYKRSFFNDEKIAVSTARAGNVIGGGDFAVDRIIPDCVRAAKDKKDIIVRNPYSTRPYQHVLEPLCAYLLIVQKQYESFELAGYYNVGPDECDCVTTGEIVDMFVKHYGEGLSWKNIAEKNAPHEANFLKLDCSKLKSAMGWKPVWNIDKAIEKTVEWSKAYINNDNLDEITNKQIAEFLTAED